MTLTQQWRYLNLTIVAASGRNYMDKYVRTETSAL